jgi:uncharacterized protein
LKLHADQIEGVNVVSGYAPGVVKVNGQEHLHAVLVPWNGEVLDWQADDAATLTAEHFQRVADLKPEVVIYGSGDRIRFPSGALLKPLMSQRIGIETMDSGAACRTYNVLAGEGRSVVLALLVPPAR